MKKEAKKFIKYLNNNHIEFVEMTIQEENEYKQKWFERVVPISKQQNAMECSCFDTLHSCGYLWHVFSYGILDYIEKDDAKKAFSNLAKQEAVLLVNWKELDGIASYKLNDISKIPVETYNFLTDIILTDSMFRWTYVKTHEIMCGPYLHQIHKV